jgi:hypothetical protein
MCFLLLCLKDIILLTQVHVCTNLLHCCKVITDNHDDDDDDADDRHSLSSTIPAFRNVILLGSLFIQINPGFSSNVIRQTVNSRYLSLFNTIPAFLNVTWQWTNPGISI